MPHRLGCPGGGLIRVTGRARIRDFVFVRHRWGDECERVRAHEHAGNGDFNFRHVAGHAFAARGAVFVVRVRSKCRRAGSVPRAGGVAIKANLVCGLSQLRVIPRAMHIVTVEAGDAAAVHDALHKIISLHSVFVRSAVRKMRET